MVPHKFQIRTALLMTSDPYAKHFSVIKVSDLVLVDEHGEIQEPTGHTVNRAGFIIHSVLHQMRPDINAAVHMHSPHGRAWSAFGRPIEMLVQGMSNLDGTFKVLVAYMFLQIHATFMTIFLFMKALEGLSSQKKKGLILLGRLDPRTRTLSCRIMGG